jgi:hypothetical protein
VFASARADGQTQQKVMLPDGTEIGLISIKAGTPSVRLDEAGGLYAWCEEHSPDSIEQHVAEYAWTMPEVVALVAEHFPGFVTSRVSPDAKAALDARLVKSGGCLISDAGEKAKLATVTRNAPTGAFTYRPAAGSADRIMSLWLAGQLRDITFGPLPLPAPEPQDIPADPEFGAPGDPFYFDEHGFRSPELAAHHACVVQGGYSTPPIEAYRMLRDASRADDQIAVERVLGWLQDHGLDPADPREGKDTPWPLPAAGGDAGE